MKRKLFLILVAVLLSAGMQAQTTADSLKIDPTKGDTSMAASIIDNYLGYVNFNHLLKDSILFVQSWVVEREHPEDTIKILRWYGANRQNRIEMWQKGRMEDAYYSDGKKLFKRFSRTYRTWRNMSQPSYYDNTMALDIRGALYDWRSKGAEAYYMGQYTYNDHPAYRVFVMSPGTYDRNYFFEKETGLLFVVTEEDHLFGDAEPALDAQRVDWRGWHEFTPFRGCLLPTIESYQIEGQLFIIHNKYEMVAPNSAYFNKNVY